MLLRTPFLILPLVLLACGQPPPADVAAVAAPAARGPNAFDVSLTFTPRASEMLAGRGEAVTVDAMFFGEPGPDGLKPEDEAGIIVMGGERVDVAPANAVVTVAGDSYDPARAGDIEGEKQVLVNVFTARRTHADNLISCGIYQGPVSMAQKQPVEIRCDLIE